MSYPGSSQSYRETDINTASPARLVVMLYQGAIRFIKQAEEAVHARNIEGKRVAVDRTIAILQHLNGSLSFDHNEVLAKDLCRLYEYLVQRIMEGSANLQAEPFREAAGLLAKLLESWEEVARQEEAAAGARIANMTAGAGRLTLQA